jgi:hypothetical protein
LNNRNNINPNHIQVGDRIRLIHVHDIHADVKESDTGTVLGLSTVPKDSQSDELDLIALIQWDHSKSRAALTEE